MKRAHDSWVVLGVLCGFMLVQPSQRVRAQSPGSARTWLLAADNPQKSETSAQSPYEVLDPAKYQCFVKNWDDMKNPVLYACIRSPAEWDKIFHPAPVMGSRKPFAPEPKVFETQDLLVVARVMPALDNDKAGASVFRVQRVGVSGPELVLDYKYDSPKAEGKTYQVKQYLAVLVPKATRKEGRVRITIVENGSRLGTLDLEKGRWSVPDLSEVKGD